MMGVLLLSLVLLSCLAAPALGNGAQAGTALFQGADRAVAFCLELGGSICLWSAMLELMERCGLTARLGTLLQPLLRRLFPRSFREEATRCALTENLSANLLGLGSAATPAGLRAARAMAGRGEREELGTLVVLNTASVQLLPSTIAAVRAAAGAADAFDILPAVWASSLLSVGAGLSAARLGKKLWRQGP